MKFLLRLAGLLLLSALGWGTSCATLSDVPAALSQPLDSSVQRQVAAAHLRTGKVKFTGPVTFQFGGSNNTATATNAAKAKAPVASAPHAAVMQASNKANSIAYWVVIALVCIGLCLIIWLRYGSTRY
jgi:hypothetical protein